MIHQSAKQEEKRDRGQQSMCYRSQPRVRLTISCKAFGMNEASATEASTMATKVATASLVWKSIFVVVKLWSMKQIVHSRRNRCR